MTMHYHGLPITPSTKLAELGGCCFCVSYAAPGQVEQAHEIGQSVMLDNGAFSFWREREEGRKSSAKALATGEGNWSGFYRWIRPWLDFPTTWAVIPDVIDGSVEDNDRLLVKWFTMRLPKGAPVWHMNEPLERLRRLVAGYEKVCIGSSGAYANLGTPQWHRRMEAAMNVACKHETPWLHMLRGMAMSESAYPFASVDSTDIARNHAGNHTRGTPAKDPVAMARRWDRMQCPAVWWPREQLALVEGGAA